MLRPWAHFNFGDAELAPIPVWDATPPEDASALATTWQTASTALTTLQGAAANETDYNSIGGGINGAGIARDLAGFSLGEADVLLKAVGKKIKELVAEQRIKFVSGCIEHGIKKDVAEHVFDFIEPFAGYGFNRSHAACYALIGYQTAYLKAHYPAEFMAALLTSDQNDTDRIAIEVREAREIGIEVLQPDVNESFESFAVIRGNDGIERIRFGLQAIKNVGSVCAEEIVKERERGGKFKSLEDFVIYHCPAHSRALLRGKVCR